VSSIALRLAREQQKAKPLSSQCASKTNRTEGARSRPEEASAMVSKSGSRRRRAAASQRRSRAIGSVDPRTGRKPRDHRGLRSVFQCINPEIAGGFPEARREPSHDSLDDSLLVIASVTIRDGISRNSLVGPTMVSTVAPIIRGARRGRRCRGALRSAPGPALSPAQSTSGTRKVACRSR
jgi:hypothetical protein